jgi:hypothetical protein
MSINNLLVRDVTIVTAETITDRYGNKVRVWTNASRNYTRGWLGRNSETEDGSNREGFVTTWTLRLPPGTAITAGDLVEVDGVTYHVEGPPNKAWTPRGEHHVRAELRLVEG